MPADSLVFIVVLNWNNAPDTLECLASLQQLDYPNYRILVVDNGSEDGSPEKIRARYPEVDLLVLGQNLGYGAGNNAGIHCALEHDAEYVLLLNNDALVSSTALTRMVQIAETKPNCGLVGPLTYCTPDKDLLFSAGGRISWYAARACHRYMFVPQHCYTARNPESVDFIAGCAMLASRRLIKTAGLLDPDYFLNLEDVEWCVRARRHGFSVWLAPEAQIWHKVSGTLGQGSPMNAYYMTRNTLRFFWENAPRGLRSWCVFVTLLRTMRTILAWSLKPRYRSRRFYGLRRANLLALRDFFTRRYGPMGRDVANVSLANH
ncbi:MAG: glycosyltransferase family 2 protein [Chloroflexia bacterium]